MTRRQEVIFLNGWRGGLNLTDSQQQLRQDESPDCLNVVFDDRGGFTTRRGFKDVAYSSGLTNPKLMKAYGNQVFVSDSVTGRLWIYTGSALTDTTNVLTDDTSQQPWCEQYDRDTYFANCYTSGVLQMRKLSAAGTYTTLGNTFNNDYASPSGGHMPKARLIVNHAGYMWCADTVEGGVRHASRIRFSHVGKPEDWSAFDYFDIDPQNDRDSIRALLPFYNELLVFKESGVWAVGGWDRDSFYQRIVAPTAGACVPTAVTASAAICYWVSNEGNVFAYNGERAVPIGDNIRGLWRDGEVNCSSVSHAVWSRGRLFCVIDTKSNQNGLYVYDPAVGPSGAWARYNYKPSSLVYWQQGAGSDQLLFTLTSSFNVDEFLASFDPGQQPNLDATDMSKRLYNMGDETVTEDIVDTELVPISGYLKTHWITGGETATRKRWRRPRVTAGALKGAQLQMQLYRNYNSVIAAKSALFNIGVTDETALEWDVGEWNVDSWAGEQSEYSFVRVPSLGSANAIQLEFRSVVNPSQWWVDSVSIPFRRRSIK